MIESTENRWVYSPNGITTDFPYYNLVLAADDLTVTLYDAQGSTVLLPAHDVGGVGNPAGGVVAFESAPPATAGGILVLERHTLAVQEGRYQDFIQEPAAVREGRMDRLTALAQEAITGLARAIRFSPLEPDGPLVLPPPLARAGYMLGFDGAGYLTIGKAVPTGSVLVSPYMETALGKLNAGELLAYQGVSANSVALLQTASDDAALASLGFTPFSASLRLLADAEAWRNALGVQPSWVIGSDINAAASLDLDSGTPGDERGVIGTTAIGTIVGEQTRVRLVSRTNGARLTHGANIVSRTASTIFLRLGDAVDLVRSSTGEWREIAFHPALWQSGTLALAAGANTTVPHHLGKRVGAVRLYAKCITAEAEWAPADFASNERLEPVTDMGTNLGWSAFVDDTNVIVRIAANGLAVVSKGTAGYTSINPANWEFWIEVDPRI